MKLKTVFRQTMVLLLSVLLCLSALPVSAAADATLTASSVSGKPGESITVQIAISNNPGVVGFGVGIDYDQSVLTFEKIQYLPNYTGESNKFGATNTTGKCGHPLLAQCTFDPSVESGVKDACVLFTLIFKIADQAKSGKYSITPSIDTTNGTGCVYGWDHTNPTNPQKNFTVSCVAGTITVSGQADTPVDPPVDPVDPPVDPIDPPDEPDRPSDIIVGPGTNDPVDPPITPDDPDTPDKPDTPDQPDTPDKPDKPDDPVTPDEPGKDEPSSGSASGDSSGSTSEKPSGGSSEEITSGGSSGAVSGGDSDSGSANGSDSSSEKPADKDPEKAPSHKARTLLLITVGVLLIAAAGYGCYRLLLPKIKAKRNRKS